MVSKKVKDFLRSGEMHMEFEYKGDKNAASEWHRLRNPLRVVLNAIIIYFCMFIPSLRIKRGLYRLLGTKIGKNVVIAPEVLLDPIFPELIELKDNSIIGWGTKILTHEFTTKTTRIGRVKIGENTVVGAFSVVRCGVEIKEDCVVAMMSLVHKDIESFELVGGVPEHEIRKLEKV